MVANIILLLWLAIHPVHVTLTSVDHIRGTDSLMVLVKMNYDLFRRDYQTIDDDRDVDRYKDKPFPTIFAYSYLQQKIAIYLDNKLLYGKLLNMDVAEEEISLKLLYIMEKKPRKITISNKLLLSLYGDAENFTIVSIGNFEKGIKMTSDNTEETFKLK